MGSCEHVSHRRLYQVIFFSSLFVLLALTACQPEQAQPQPLEPQPNQDSQTLTGSRPTITVLLFGTFSPNADQIRESQILAWGEENDIKIAIIDQMPASPEAMLQNQNFPDCGNAGDLNFWLVNDALVETTDLINRLNQLEGGIFEGALASSRMRGKQWSVPITINSQVFYVRQDKLAEHGLSLPETWQDVRQVAETITIPDEFWGWGIQLGRSGDAEGTFRSLLWSHGGSVWDEESKPALDSPATREVLALLKETWDSGVVPPDALDWQEDSNNLAYQAGRVGMVSNAGSILNYLQREDPNLLDDTAIILMPAGPAGRFVSGSFNHWAIFKASQHADLCLKLTEWLFSPQQLRPYYEAGGGNFLPIYKDMLNDEMWQEPYRRAIADQIPFTYSRGYPGPVTPWSEDSWNGQVISQMIRRVLAEGWSSDRAIEEADQALWQLYDQWQENLP